MAAAVALIAEGKATADMFDFDANGYRAPTADFIDGVAHDGTRPNACIDSLTVGLKSTQTVMDGAKLPETRELPRVTLRHALPSA